MKAQTFLPLFSGFYGSHWDSVDFYGEEEYFSLPDGDEFWEYVDWDKYHNHIAKEMCYEVCMMLSEFVTDIEFESISSQKYYNFENDSINCTIEFNEGKVQDYIRSKGHAFSEYIRKKYTSRDGFISFYSNDANEWIDAWTEDTHMVGAVLQFICEEEGFDEPFDLNDCHIGLFYKDEIYQHQIA